MDALLFLLFLPNTLSVGTPTGEGYSLSFYAENIEYCQSVYWHPNAEELLQEANCDIQKTSDSIFQTKKGKRG